MKLSLKKHDRICFLGDSITAGGRWISEVFEYFLKNHPELRIGLYNCGISGSKGSDVMLRNRLYSDCFNLFPKYVVVMFGINDINPGLYNPKCTDPEIIKNREELLNRYESTIETIIESCRHEEIIPIICSPTPFDEYNNPGAAYCKADCAMQHCHDVTEKLAKKHDLIFVDMRKTLMNHISEYPINDDRIHPNEYGQHLLAETFLQAIGAKEIIEPEKECEISEKNQQRYDIEHIIRNIEFVERNYMGWQFKDSLPEISERKRLLKEKAANDKSAWAPIVCESYLKHADDGEELRGRLVRITCEMYDEL